MDWEQFNTLSETEKSNAFRAMQTRISELESALRSTTTDHHSPTSTDADLHSLKSRILDRISQHVNINRMEDMNPVFLGSNHEISPLGYSRAELAALGPDLVEKLVHPEDMQHINGMLKTLTELKDGETARVTLRGQHKDGGWRWLCYEFGVLEYDAQGNPHIVFGIVTDVTTERNHELLLEKLLGVSLNGIEIVQHGRLLYSNQVLEKMLGYHPDELSAIYEKDYLSLVHPDDKAQMMRFCKFDQIGPANPHSRINARYLRKDSSPIWLDINAQYTEHNGEGALLLTYTDISEQIAYEKQLSDSEMEMRALFDNSIDGIFIADDTGTYIDINKAGSDLLGGSRDDIIGKTIQDFTDTSKEEFHDTWQAFHHEGRLRGLYNLRTLSGESKVIDFRASANYVPGKHMSIMTDITNRFRLESELQASKRAYETLTRNIPNFISRVDRDLRLVYLNPPLLRVLGLTPEQIYGKTLEEISIIEADMVQQWNEARRQVLTSGQPTRIEYDYMTADGLRYFQVNLVPEFDDSGQVQTVLSVSNDITEARRIMQELKASQRDYQALTNNIPDYIARVDRDLRFVYANDALLKTFGLPMEEVYGKQLHELPNRNPSITPLWIDARTRVFETGQLTTLEYEYPGEDRMCTMQAKLMPEFDEHGQVSSVLSLSRDITETKDIIHNLSESQEFIQRVADASPYMIWVRDQQKGVLIFANRRMREFFGAPEDYENATAYSAYVNQCLHPDDKENEKQFTRRVAGLSEINEIVTGEFRMRNLAGEYRWLRMWKTIFRFDENNEIVQSLGMAQDITHEKETEEKALRFAMEQERVRLISNFVTAMSHEFRTPLSGIYTSLHMLRRVDELERIRHYARRIETEANQITVLLDALQDMSQLDATNELELRPVDIAGLLTSICVAYEDIATNQGVRLTKHFSEERTLIPGDEHKLRMAIGNIIDNGIRYTRAGGSVQVSLNTSQHFAVITVQDTGIGMPVEVRVRIFDRFYRQDEARTERGIGLGLSIARKVIELHHGRILISSEAGKGTTVAVQLPFTHQPQP